MKAYEFEYFDGYIIPEIDGVKVLVDTGCPITVSSGSNLPSLGDIWMTPSTPELNPQIMAGFPAEEFEFEVLLGRNYLGIVPFLVDWDERKIIFEMNDKPNGEEISFNVTPVGASVNAMVNEQEVSLIIDTGAKISFLGQHKFSENPVVGRVDDYHLTCGHFTAELIQVNFEKGAVEMELFAGRLDNALFDQLRSVSIDGILGNDIFNHYNRVWYDFPGQRLVLVDRRDRPMTTERVSKTVTIDQK